MENTIEKIQICKHNQSGYCKFGQTCSKKHDNRLCESHDECMVNKCTKRHPKTCKNFKTNGKCRHREKCAYKHEAELNNQDKLNQTIFLLIVNQQKEINNLKEQVTSMDLSRKEKHAQDEQKQENLKQDLPESLLECEICSYTCKKKEYLIKHMNTKHINQSVKECHKEVETTVEVQEHHTEKVKPKNAKVLKFKCDECKCTFK